METAKALKERIHELEGLLEISDRKSDILTNLLKEANAEFERALEMITRTEANFRAVFENAPEAIYIINAESGRILDCNPFLVDWLGYSRETLLTMTVDDLLVASKPEVRHNIQRAVTNGLGGVQERRYRKADGSIVDAEVTGTRVAYEGKMSVAILVRDVTQRKQLDALSRYKELFENVSDPVFINDFQGSFLEANAGACRLFGYTRKQLLAMRVKELVNPRYVHVLAEAGKEIERGKTIQFEMELIAKRGEPIPFEFHARPITFLGKPAVLSVARDLSWRKQLESTLIRAERLAALGEMASGIAHNFNNLLQMIMGAAQAALSELSVGRVGRGQEAIKAIVQSADRAADVVRRIREFTDDRTEGVEGAELFELSEIVREAVDLTKPLWKGMPILHRYQVKQVHAGNCFINGSPSGIHEVVVNLIRNAIEAMPQGGVLTILTTVDRSRVCLRISDTGNGIPRENLQRIFEPFFTTKGPRASGLGLSSSYGIVKRHQGEIRAESRSGKGATFTVILPRARKRRQKAMNREDSAEPGIKIKFLVIDDEVTILKAMEIYFSGSGVEIASALSGRQGLDTFRRGEFDVVLCDLGMDDMDGWEVGARIRAYCEGKGIPKPAFLIYTGWDQKFDPVELKKRGVDRAVIKPVPYDGLLRIVREVVAERSAPASREAGRRKASRRPTRAKVKMPRAG